MATYPLVIAILFPFLTNTQWDHARLGTGQAHDNPRKIGTANAKGLNGPNGLNGLNGQPLSGESGQKNPSVAKGKVGGKVMPGTRRSMIVLLTHQGIAGWPKPKAKVEKKSDVFTPVFRNDGSSYGIGFCPRRRGGALG